jgi:hypothetical protein
MLISLQYHPMCLPKERFMYVLESSLTNTYCSKCSLVDALLTSKELTGRKPPSKFDKRFVWFSSLHWCPQYKSYYTVLHLQEQKQFR